MLSYKGELAVVSRDNTLLCVNKIKIDEYLASVISSELAPKAPLEALKAQAVASRTFMLKNIRKHNAEGFDLCDSRTACCQVYKGAWNYGETVYSAVKESKGLILAYKNEPIEALFSSCCGGRTCGYEAVFPSQPALPYLTARQDNDTNGKIWCANDRRFSWKRAFKNEILEAVFTDPSPGQITVEKDSSGNILYLLKGGEKISVLFFRKGLAKLGFSGIDSNLFEFKEEKDAYILKGNGFGHRMGMCQSGAVEMAKCGKTFREILSHYYNCTIIKEKAQFARDFKEE